MTYRLSIAERIALTSGLSPTDAKVLQALARYAHFETGKNARPSFKTLIARAELSRATVWRALVRLADPTQPGGPWIVATSRAHRHSTHYDICLDRLATNVTGAKVVARNPNVGTQNETQNADQSFNMKPNTQEDLSFIVNDQSFNLSTFEFQNETPIPSTYPDLDPSAPSLRAGTYATGLTAADQNDAARSATTGESSEALHDGTTPLRSGPADLRADGRNYPDDAGAHARGPGGDQAPSSDSGVHLRQPADSSSTSGAPGSSAPVQQTFGPLDLSDAPTKPVPQWGQMIEAFKRGLDWRKTGSG